MSVSAEMPRYRSHKVVNALKIEKIELKDTGWGTVYPTQNKHYAPFDVPPQIAEVAKNHPGGYVVVYEDGYTSFSPAKAFEEGYVQISGPKNPAMSGYDDGELGYNQGEMDMVMGYYNAKRFFLKPGEVLMSEVVETDLLNAWRLKLKEHFVEPDAVPKFSFEYTPAARSYAHRYMADFVARNRQPIIGYVD